LWIGFARAQAVNLRISGGTVAAALERAVRWYEANGYIAKSRAKRMVTPPLRVFVVAGRDLCRA